MNQNLIIFYFFIYIQIYYPIDGVTNTLVDNDTSSTQCSQMSENVISRCMEPILKYSNNVQKSSPKNAKWTLQSGYAFKELCSLYKDFQKCTSSITCHSLSKLGIEASYHYMCGEGYPIFEKHSKCFSEIETENTYLECKNNASNEMETILDWRQKDQIRYFAELCNVMENYLECCKPYVVNKCGKQAWELVSKITTDSLQVTMPNCNVNKALFI
uniref:DUF19 domain-containing protein n=1 Tax=Strongyloides venezuelensis TaxID=75913 RepID=A0A0K0FVF5_STRVS